MNMRWKSGPTLLRACATLAIVGGAILPNYSFASVLFSQPDFSQSYTGCSTFVREQLGLDNAPAWSGIIKQVKFYTTRTDLSGYGLVFIIRQNTGGAQICSGYFYSTIASAGYTGGGNDLLTLDGSDWNEGNCGGDGGYDSDSSGWQVTPNGSPIYYEWYLTGGASGVMTSLGDGTNAFILACDDGTCSGYTPPVDTTTRIIDFDPQNGTTTSNPVTFSLHAYVNEEDIGDFIGVNFTLHNIDQNVLLGSIFSPYDIVFLDGFQATTSGDFYFSTTTVVAEGNYRVEASIRRSFLSGIFNSPFSSINDDQSHQFIVGSPTFIGNISQQSFSSINQLFASTSATSTSALAGSCNVLSGFSVTNCLAFLFIPDAGLVYDSLTDFRDKVSTHFPLGYLTDFIGIISTTTTSSLTVINATVPSVLPGHGSSITLSLTGILDSVLYATTSQFTMAGASTTQTFYDFTSYYWRIFVYLGAFLYIFGRIVGSHLVPSLGNPFQEMSGQRNVSNDAYRLKADLFRRRYSNVIYTPNKEKIE